MLLFAELGINFEHIWQKVRQSYHFVFASLAADLDCKTTVHVINNLS